MPETAQAVRNVQKEVAHEVPGGDLEPAEDLGNLELLPERQLGPADDFYSYGDHDASPTKSSTTAVTTTLATAIGKSPFQPRLMSWS